MPSSWDYSLLASECFKLVLSLNLNLKICKFQPNFVEILFVERICSVWSGFLNLFSGALGFRKSLGFASGWRSGTSLRSELASCIASFARWGWRFSWKGRGFTGTMSGNWGLIPCAWLQLLPIIPSFLHSCL
jgi:hypothetical protein